MAFNAFCGDAERYRFESIYANEVAGWNIGKASEHCPVIIHLTNLNRGYPITLHGKS
jgi:hypothetical protein